MLAHPFKFLLLVSAPLLASSSLASANPFHFTTGSPDGLIATASRPSSGASIEIESADDFVLPTETVLKSGTFTGLLPSGTDVSDIQNVDVEVYRIFPLDSADPPSGNVPTRTNSPSDTAFLSRDAQLGELSFSISTLNPDFAAANSVVNGINPLPNVFTGGEGPAFGMETQFAFSFLTPVDLDAGHYFFVPQVQLSNGNFLWLSAPRILGPNPDLQTWIRDGNLAPDWLRIGTDITHQGPFNASFSLNGSSVPEPASWAMMLIGFGIVGSAFRRTRKSNAARAAVWNS